MLEYKFMTNQFRIDYHGLTPQIIKNITSKSNKECLATYLNKKKFLKNRSYQYHSKKRFEHCTLETYSTTIQQKEQIQNYFPADIDVLEVIWEQQPAIMLIFQSQSEKQQLQQIEELKLRDQYKDDLLVSVSHDFKTPINGIVAIVQYLEQIVVDQVEINYLIILKKWAQLLLYMISDILDFSRIQKNNLRLTNTTFYIQAIVQEIIDLVSLQANQKGIIVQKKITFGDRLMYSDPNRIKQILLNLLSNSLKFTEKGKIDIVVDYKNSEIENQQVRLITISVSDTGVGIPDNVKPKLFQMYGTFDFTNNGSNKHGIGLGLVICKKLVGLLGPTDNIDLISQVGVGSKFSFDVYINNDQRNLTTITNSKEMTNFYKQDTKQISDDQNSANQLLTSQFTIFNQSLLAPPMQNQKKLNKKGISTLQEIQDRKLSNSIYQLRKVQRKKTQKKCQVKHENQGNFGNLCYICSVEDSDHSKQKNMEQYLELNSELTHAKLIKKINKQVDINSSLNTPLYQIDSMESPPLQNRQRKPLQITESIDDMMKKLFPEPCTILVVDDSPVNVIAFRLILTKYDFITVEEAYNGEQALQKIKSGITNDQRYQYIFMDLTMPIMNGYEATEQIRLLNNNLVPKSYIIALTGYDDLKEKEKCQQKGFDAFVSKPIKIIDIISVINEVKNSKEP
ncbi:unnamed protein product (macronuclear) [Paramecium tetraurelia]|uniref:Histidine kinase n=1 Tax=Paramecium tetraurelia TaxID=5888 RepID=A0DT16_PARTE|nr:uncharacterized protein GSPATT00019876001 [Paramecium tetraurelia]CAK86183.1 unnamed protein product [Paramecium tetraurelia]|eukprot:XP_001453580.1 hypothetical protein (macronuclear) [Paramecium tetraurelia strain d4-2]